MTLKFGSEKQLTKEVSSLFEDNLEYQNRYDLKNDFIIKFIKKYGKINQNVLDVGGINGNVLDNIFKYTPIKKGYNLELVRQFSKYQVNEDIIFINGSALNLPFKDNSFDFVVISALLHHLVGSGIRESKKNIQKAVDELLRVTRNGGYVVIEDIWNKYKIFSALIFYILLILSKFSLKIKYFSIHKHLIVLFLTIKEIRSLFDKENVKIIEEKIIKHNQPLKFKVTILLSKMGNIHLAVLKEQSPFEEIRASSLAQ